MQSLCGADVCDQMSQVRASERLARKAVQHYVLFVVAQIGIVRSHIGFAQIQDAPMSFIERHPFACNLVGEMTKDQEVVVAERRDNEENNHFVGSNNLKEIGSKSSA